MKWFGRRSQAANPNRRWISHIFPPKEPRAGKLKTLMRSMRDRVRPIYFDHFAEAIEKRGERELSRLFASSLREWAANDAGSRNPKDWQPY